MEIKQLCEKYGLTKDDYWEFKRGGKSSWIITHDACEKIAHQESIKLTWEVIYIHPECVMLKVTGKKSEVIVETAGEASKFNCKMNYYLCMAEKRGKDRAILKLINAYEYGVYSETESDDFKRPANAPTGGNQNG